METQPVLVAPVYLGGRDQEDNLSRPAQTNSLQDPISKIPNMGLGCNSVVELFFFFGTVA
jgi:hypothetical protein